MTNLLVFSEIQPNQSIGDDFPGAVGAKVPAGKESNQKGLGGLCREYVICMCWIFLVYLFVRKITQTVVDGLG